jgi:anti-anti-sigma factor
MLRTLVARFIRTRNKGKLMTVESCLSVSLLFGATPEEQSAGVTVVWLHGEHDAFTATQLSEAIRRAVDVDGMDVTLDLSDVTFMSAATIRVIVDSGKLLEAKSLTLRLRCPSLCAWRIIELSGLCGLFDNDKWVRDRYTFGCALGSWVKVPVLPSESARSRLAQRRDQLKGEHLDIELSPKSIKARDPAQRLDRCSQTSP